MEHIDKSSAILLSVIIPIYNVERYLDTCIQSILHQSLQELEIILVDDESPDRCPQMCDDYAKQDNRIKVIHKKNGGLGYARNSGLEMATGKYVTFVDSDDYIDLNTFETVVNLAEEHQLDCVRYKGDRFVTEGRFTERVLSNEYSIFQEQDLPTLKLNILSEALFEGQQTLLKGGSSCMGIYRLSILNNNQIRFHSERELISEDVVFVYDVYSKIKRLGAINYSFYHYRVNPHSLTTAVNTGKLAKAFIFCKFFEHKLLNDGYSQRDAKCYPMAYYLSSLRAQSKLIFLSNMTIKEKKKWFIEQTKHPYMKEIISYFPIHKLPKLQQIHWYFSFKRYFLFLYLIVLLHQYIRRRA